MTKNNKCKQNIKNDPAKVETASPATPSFFKKKDTKANSQKQPLPCDNSLIEFTEEELKIAGELAKKVNGSNPKSAGYFYCPQSSLEKMAKNKKRDRSPSP